MKKTKILLWFFCSISIIACKNNTKEKSKATYYRDVASQKIINESKYIHLKDSLSKQFNINETIISVKDKKDSIIKTYYNLKFPKKMTNLLENVNTFIGKQLPFETLTTLDGNSISLNNNNGLPTLVNFWFTTCRPCIEEMPEMNQLKETYKDQVNFVAVTFETKAKVFKLIEKHPFNFKQVINAKQEINKLNNSMYPLNVFLDKQGIVTYVTGMNPGGNIYNEMLENLIASKKTPHRNP